MNKIKLSEIIEFLGEEVTAVYGQTDGIEIEGLAMIDKSGDKLLDWVNQSRTDKQACVENSGSRVIIVDKSVVYSSKLSDSGKVLIQTNSPRNAIGIIGNQFFILKPIPSIHQSAIVSSEAHIHASVHIGANSFIGKCSIGEGCVIHNNVTICNDVKIGASVEIFSGAVLGTNGLGCYQDNDGILRMFPHLGKLIICDNVVIGANCSIARGALSDTVIGMNSKINALCFIAHNCIIGNNVLITGSTMLNGSVEVGDDSTIFSQVIVRDQTKIGARSIVGMGSVVTKDIPSDEVWVGNPARFMKKNEQ